jgi:hypothetical protein
MRYDRPLFFFYSQMAPSCTDNLFHVWWSSMELSNLFTKRDLPCGSIGTMNSISHFLISNPCVGLHFFLFEETSLFRKAYFVGLDERVKLRLSQTLTINTCPDSNSRPAVQISNPLPSRYTYWVRVGLQ